MPSTTSEIVYAPMNEADARRLTDRIRHATEKVWELITEAHDRKAYTALGYRTFRAYVEGEFAMTRGHAYRLLAHGKVITALREAGEVSPDGDIPEATTRRLAAGQRASQPDPHPHGGDRSEPIPSGAPPAPPPPTQSAAPGVGLDDEPSEPGAAGAPGLIEVDAAMTAAEAQAFTDEFRARHGTDHRVTVLHRGVEVITVADLLSLIRDLDRLLLPHDDGELREAWALSEADEEEAVTLMERVREVLGDAAPTVQTEPAPGDAVPPQDAPEETPSPDPRIPAIRSRLEALSAKQRAAFFRVHNLRAETLDGWVAGLNDHELDTACSELGLVGEAVP